MRKRENNPSANVCGIHSSVDPEKQWYSNYVSKDIRLNQKGVAEATPFEKIKKYSVKNVDDIDIRN